MDHQPPPQGQSRPDSPQPLQRHVHGPAHDGWRPQAIGVAGLCVAALGLLLASIQTVLARDQVANASQQTDLAHDQARAAVEELAVTRKLAAYAARQASVAEEALAVSREQAAHAERQASVAEEALAAEKANGVNDDRYSAVIRSVSARELQRPLRNGQTIRLSVSNLSQRPHTYRLIVEAEGLGVNWPNNFESRLYRRIDLTPRWRPVVRPGMNYNGEFSVWFSRSHPIRARIRVLVNDRIIWSQEYRYDGSTGTYR